MDKNMSWYVQKDWIYVNIIQKASSFASSPGKFRYSNWIAYIDKCIFKPYVNHGDCLNIHSPDDAHFKQ